MKSPSRQAGGQGFDLDQKIRRLGQRLATIQGSGLVQSIDHGVELAFRSKAKGIDPGQSASGLSGLAGKAEPVARTMLTPSQMGLAL